MNRRVVAVIVLCWFNGGLCNGDGPNILGQDEPVRISRETQGDSDAFVVDGLSEAQVLHVRRGLEGGNAAIETIFSVYVGETDENRTPIWGSCRVEQGQLVFRPRYPLKAGLNYVAVLQLPGLRLRTPISIAALPVSPQATRVAAIYPSADRLPQNLLRVYIYFSGPMSRGDAYTHLELRDAAGELVPSPFFELPQELWDPQQERFSLLFDPGRIKKELTPRRDLGPPLEPGQRYTLIVKRTWKDAQNQPLEQETRKSFSVVESWESQLSMEQWEFKYPTTRNSLEPLVIHFDRAMNRGMLESSIRVLAGDSEWKGTVEVRDQERTWSFHPQEPWSNNEYILAIDNDIEDIAGNRLARPFEVDLSSGTELPALPTEGVRLIPFKIF